MRYIHGRIAVRRLGAMIGVTGLLAAVGAADSPAERRAALYETAMGAEAAPALGEALGDGNAVVRRTAVRLLARIAEPARGEAAEGLGDVDPAVRAAALRGLAEALGNDDFVVRLVALRALATSLGSGATPHLATALGDGSPIIRQIAVSELVNIQPRDERVRQLIEAASKDGSAAVREIAGKALWPFSREVTSIRDRKDWDHDVQVAEAIPLPAEGWRFALDPDQDGHVRKWYEPGFDDSGWAEIRIEQAWEEQGHEFDGVAWYRTGFPLGDKPDCLAVELHFGAVDEIAWVWVNGVYVGAHDLGPEGWDQAFALDVTEEVKWGAENQLTVRVHDSTFAGGIWKPVTLQALK